VTYRLAGIDSPTSDCGNSYGVNHPVVNDKDLTMWNAVGVTSWPTLALVGPRGNLLNIWSGGLVGSP